MAHHPQGLENLILNNKGKRTYAELSRDCGGFPSDKRLHQMVSRPNKNFPDPETIKGLARGLRVPAAEVITATARSLGIEVGEDSADLVIPGARELPQSSQELLLGMAHEMLELQHSATASALPE